MQFSASIESSVSRSRIFPPFEMGGFYALALTVNPVDQSLNFPTLVSVGIARALRWYNCDSPLVAGSGVVFQFLMSEVGIGWRLYVCYPSPRDPHNGRFHIAATVSVPQANAANLKTREIVC